VSDPASKGHEAVLRSSGNSCKGADFLAAGFLHKSKLSDLTDCKASEPMRFVSFHARESA
jgi:hypothetical protein